MLTVPDAGDESFHSTTGRAARSSLTDDGRSRCRPGPNQTKNVEGLEEGVPMNALLGAYEYIAYYGDYPSDAEDLDSFEFTVVDR